MTDQEVRKSWGEEAASSNTGRQLSDSGVPSDAFDGGVQVLGSEFDGDLTIDHDGGEDQIVVVHDA